MGAIGIGEGVRSGRKSLKSGMSVGRNDGFPAANSLALPHPSSARSWLMAWMLAKRRVMAASL